MKELIEKLILNAHNAQLCHWATSSYAQHVALEEHYDGMRGFTDSLVEVLVGIGFNKEDLTDDIVLLTSNNDVSAFVEEIRDLCEELNEMETPSRAISNIVDDIDQLCYTTIYKLENLS